jgi:hypothetical protein
VIGVQGNLGQANLKRTEMKLFAIDQADIDKLAEIICNRLTKKLEDNRLDKNDYRFDNEELCNYLKISKRLLQSYRDKGRIRFRQEGAKIWYKYQWVQDFLERKPHVAKNPPKQHVKIGLY